MPWEEVGIESKEDAHRLLKEALSSRRDFQGLCVRGSVSLWLKGRSCFSQPREFREI